MHVQSACRLSRCMCALLWCLCQKGERTTFRNYKINDPLTSRTSISLAFRLCNLFYARIPQSKHIETNKHFLPFIHSFFILFCAVDAPAIRPLLFSTLIHSIIDVSPYCIVRVWWTVLTYVYLFQRLLWCRRDDDVVANVWKEWGFSASKIARIGIEIWFVDGYFCHVGLWQHRITDGM